MDLQTYHVAALSGLNIRNIMSLYGEVVDRKSYNQSVDINLEGASLPAVIDNLLGSWVQVASDDGGFIFDGYLLPDRMPERGESLSDYATAVGFSSESHVTDLEIQESVTFPDITVQQGFLIARVLFGMSPNMELPAIINEHDVISELLPNDHIWEERLTVSRDKWELTRVDYSRIYEGGALTGHIELAGDDGIGAAISLRAVAD